MSTDNAQRRLLEALAALNRDPTADVGSAASPLAALVVGIDWARGFADEQAQPGVARIYDALGELARAVDLDTTGAHHG